MEKVQYITRSALRRASTIEVNPQARQRLQELFVNFCLILICLLLICIIVFARVTQGGLPLMWRLSIPPYVSNPIDEYRKSKQVYFDLVFCL
ncbi:cardiac phospholamban [Limosa lapponica baueri]|uniref:Phospholamban n=1 Tax=Limosa lapponica baueri TaxID=1758121 RepID=A0A2I0UGB8_LIMLA|nr:cardiac phospholamban [Limosa lapponica baueri]